MTNEEIKKKIVEILDNNIRWQPYYYISRGIVYEDDLKNIADALIAAGLNFGTIVSHTATFDLMQQKQINSLERRCAQAEHRAARAEKALMTVCVNVVTDEEDDIAVEPRARVLYKAYLKQAEKQLAEEGK